MKVKICGITQLKEAEYLNRYRPDFAGMVLFFEKSKRNISITQANELIKVISSSIKKVAVVVSPTKEQIQEIEQAGFDVLQIHGTITDEVLESITLPVWKAFNGKDMEQFSDFSSNEKISGYVFDAAEPGSGKGFDWSQLKDIPKDDRMFFLAGGLSPENVAAAIQAVHPDGVDVSSGVEYANGQGKDPAKIEEFIKNARR